MQIVILLFFLLLFIIYCIKKFCDSKKYYKLTKEDKEKFIYYRDIIKEYSIGELGVLFNGTKNTNSIIKAELEKLKFIKKIEIINNKINVLDESNLMESEKFIIDRYKFIGTKEFNNLYLKTIKFSLKEKDLIKPYTFFSHFLNIINIILFLIILLYWFIDFKFVWATNEAGFISLYFLMMMITSAVLLIATYSNGKAMYIKTDKGKELYMKLNGLKRFIRDFGYFKDKNLKEILVWEDYLLYAIILNETKK